MPRADPAMPSAVYASSAASPMSGSVRTLSRWRWASTNGSVTSPPSAGTTMAPGGGATSPGGASAVTRPPEQCTSTTAPLRSRPSVTTSGAGAVLTCGALADGSDERECSAGRQRDAEAPDGEAQEHRPGAQEVAHPFRAGPLELGEPLGVGVWSAQPGGVQG